MNHVRIRVRTGVARHRATWWCDKYKKRNRSHTQTHDKNNTTQQTKRTTPQTTTGVARHRATWCCKRNRSRFPLHGGSNPSTYLPVNLWQHEGKILRSYYEPCPNTWWRALLAQASKEPATCEPHQIWLTRL